tara:strand:+ start:1650 stop:2519 length:870 start_codon:yes stop_codon:yes gene_type:complete
MNDQTKKQYIAIAAHFYGHHMEGAVLSVSSIKQGLVSTAINFQPAYFRRLKNAIAFDLESKGHIKSATKIKAVVNPVTARGSMLVKKAKPRRAKSFADEDLVALAKHLGEADFQAAFAAVCLISKTGVRPAELSGMELYGNTLFIRGAKKTNGTRGADRLLTVTDETIRGIIATCIEILRSNSWTIDAIRHRIRMEGQKLWPRRKIIPSMYSIRHQVGANLKSSSLDLKTIAYIMGHQSTNSVRRYGDKRQGNPKAMKIEPAPEADLSAVRGKIKPHNKKTLDSDALKS